jgi:hypothetical protein
MVRAQTMEWRATKCEDTGAYRDELDMALECAEAIRREIQTNVDSDNTKGL